MRTGFRGTGGYIVEQLLMTLITCSFLIPVTITVLKIMIGNLEFPYDMQDELAISQLRHIINVSRDFTSDGSSLQFTYHESNSSLSLINGKLILKPGTQIFLSDLENAVFRIDNEIITVAFSHTGHPETERILGHV
ncbi:MAG: hypothetical protein K6D03_10715 [Solobacterium sp.]|nr:hypothetical protein [Solobacterium sp.]